MMLFSFIEKKQKGEQNKTFKLSCELQNPRNQSHLLK